MASGVAITNSVVLITLVSVPTWTEESLLVEDFLQGAHWEEPLESMPPFIMWGQISFQSDYTNSFLHHQHVNIRAASTSPKMDTLRLLNFCFSGSCEMYSITT